MPRKRGRKAENLESCPGTACSPHRLAARRLRIPALRTGAEASGTAGTEHRPHAIEVWRTLTRPDMGALIDRGHSRPSIETGP